MSIRKKFLFALLMFIVCPSLMVGLLVFHSAEQSLIANRIASLEAISEIKLKSIEDFVSRSLHEFSTVARAELLAEQLTILINHIKQPDHAGYQAATSKLDKIFQSQHLNHNLIVLTDLEGRVVYQSDSQHAPNHVSNVFSHIEQSLFERIRQGDPLIRFYFSPEEQNREGVLVAGAIRQQEQAVGLMLFEMDLQKASAIFLDNTGLGKTGKTVLGIKHGEDKFVHLITPMQGEAGEKAKKVVPFSDSPPIPPMQKAVSGENGAGLSHNYLGTELIAVWRHLPDLDLGLVAKIDTSEALSTIHLLKKTTASILLLVSLTGVLIALLMARSITRPILRR
ncbi:hypothetical protein SAMN02745165_03326 [Malonomonas rubra DSM 5091]|uniref:Cache domain-containing protein n=1 Tax=Malonomonas rubra DSM 5091 TaxID=1122189 RepID=A0A1M6MLN0_MALRU|nr:hypothetical protein [Malonomonas rubra]SHJ84362.1 hypothetical protein SAMN02745165_03326 [Malonomonas rubra DSM 5091]